MNRQETALQALLRHISATDYRFVPPTPATHRCVNARPGNETAHDLAGVFGWNRPFARDLLSEGLFSLLWKSDLLAAVGNLWKSRVRVATLGDTFYLHSGFPTQESDAVFFGPDTYRFVRAAQTTLPNKTYSRAIDLGCGSGAGGLALSRCFSIGELWLTDINPASLSFARINAAQQGRKVSLCQSDLLNSVEGTFDLIVANPPYLQDADHRLYRDGGGWLGTELGLRIVREGTARLNSGGILLMYTGVPIIGTTDRFEALVKQSLPENIFKSDYAEIDSDVFGEELASPPYDAVDRIAAISLIVTKMD